MDNGMGINLLLKSQSQKVMDLKEKRKLLLLEKGKRKDYEIINGKVLVTENHSKIDLTQRLPKEKEKIN